MKHYKTDKQEMREMVTFIIILSILAVASFAILCFAGGAK
jgi:hypothetical protein